MIYGQSLHTGRPTVRATEFEPLGTEGIFTLHPIRVDVILYIFLNGGMINYKQCNALRKITRDISTRCCESSRGQELRPKHARTGLSLIHQASGSTKAIKLEHSSEVLFLDPPNANSGSTSISALRHKNQLQGLLQIPPLEVTGSPQLS